MQTAAPAGAWPSTSQPAYRPSATLAKWAMALVGIAAAMSALRALVVLQGLPVLTAFEETGALAPVEAWQELAVSLGMLDGLALLAGGVAFLAWLSRAVGNVAALGGGRPRTGSQAAVLWWFIPVANLVKAPMIVLDLARRMARTPGERAVAIIGAWWLLWVGGQLAEGLASAGVERAKGLDQVQGLLLVLALALVAQALAGALLVWIVRRTQRHASARAADLGVVPSRAPEPDWVMQAPAPEAATAGGAPTAVPARGQPCGRCGARPPASARSCPLCGMALDTAT